MEPQYLMGSEDVQYLNGVIKEMVAERQKDYSSEGREITEDEVCADFKRNHNLALDVALEITVKLLAPELFERVLEVVQGRA